MIKQEQYLLAPAAPGGFLKKALSMQSSPQNSRALLTQKCVVFKPVGEFQRAARRFISKIQP